MAIYIQIKKVKEIDDLVFYYVSTNDFDIEKPFFISVDLTNNRIHFYKEKVFVKPTFSISLIDPVIRENEWIPYNLILRIFAAVRNALKRDGLTEYISYEA